jgi:hypothetical protein
VCQLMQMQSCVRTIVSRQVLPSRTDRNRRAIQREPSAVDFGEALRLLAPVGA